MTVEPWLTRTQAELRASLAAGHPIEPSELDDTRYLGISLGLPGFVDSLLWKTFEKTFHRDPATGELRGWNVRLEQTGWEGDPVPKQRRGVPVTFGHYRVTAEAERLVLDYGVMGDPLVALERGSSDWLLGATFVKLGGWRPLTPSFFLLRRVGPLQHIPGG